MTTEMGPLLLWVVAGAAPSSLPSTSVQLEPVVEVQDSELTERALSGVRLIESLMTIRTGSEGERQQRRVEILRAADAATELIESGGAYVAHYHAQRLYLLRSLFSRTLPVELPTGEEARVWLLRLRESARASADPEAARLALLTCARRMREAGWVEEAWNTLRSALEPSASLELLIEAFGLASRAFDWDALEELDEWLTQRLADSGDGVPIRLVWMLSDERLRLAIRLGRLDRAQRELDELLRLTARTDLPADFRAATRLAQVDCLSGLGDLDSAWIELSRPLPEDLSPTVRQLLIDQFAARRALIAADRHLRGLLSFEEAHAALDAVRRSDPTAEFVTTLTLAHICEVAGRHEEALELVAGLSSSRLAEQEFDTRALYETLITWMAIKHPRDTNGASPTAIAERAERLFEEQCEHWSQFPIEQGAVGFLQFDHRRSVLALYVQALIAAHGREIGARMGFEALLRARALGSLARRLNLAAPSLADVRRTLLDQDTGLIAYLPSDFGTLAFVVKIDSIDLFVLRSGVGFQRAARSFQAALANGLSSGGNEGSLRGAAEEIASFVLSPGIRAHLDTKSYWIIAGTDMLEGIPFEALPGTREEWLGQELATSYAPAIPFMLWTAQRSTPMPNTELVLFAEGRARNELSPPLAELDLTTDTLAKWLTRAGLDNARVFAEGDATHSALELPAARAAAWQFFAHGHYDARSGGPAILLAATDSHDGSLSREDLRTTQHAARAGMIDPAELVVLGTCASMRGPERVGDDAPDHLGTDFLVAGAQTVLLSSYELDYVATLELCAQFWQALRSSNGRPSEALRQARASVARQAHFGNPAYWSTLQIYGLDRRPTGLRQAEVPPVRSSATRPNRPWSIVIIVTVILGAIALLVARRIKGPTG